MRPFSTIVVFLVLACCPGLGLSQAARTAPELVELGVLELGKARYDKAVDAFREAVRLNPSMVAAHRGLGQTFTALGATRNAVACFQEAVRLDPSDAQSFLELGNAYLALRLAREAIAAYQEAITLRPKLVPAHLALGNAYSIAGPLEEAIASYERVIAIDPALADAHANLGMSYRRLGKDEAAMQAFQKAIRFNPHASGLYSMLGDTYSDLSRYAEAVDCLNQLGRMEHPSESLYRRRGFLNLYLSRGDAAAEDGRACLQLLGWHAEASQFMALLAHFGYRQAKRPEDAARILDEAASQADRSRWPYPVFQYLRGELDGKELLRRPINNDELTEAHGYAGLDLALKGKTAEALEHFSWVREYGNRHFVEYHFALAELERIEKSGTSSASEPK
jgi:tetratricopeptide (TPR) repeat protein